MKAIIYQVSADDGMGGERQLGLAQGNKKDIENYFYPYKPYNTAELYVRELQVLVITPEMANTNNTLQSEKAKLESRLKEINEALKV